MFRTTTVSCPYCGEVFDADVEAEEGATAYTEDCRICCQPIVFFVRVGADGGSLEIELRRENE